MSIILFMCGCKVVEEKLSACTLHAMFIDTGGKMTVEELLEFCRTEKLHFSKVWIERAVNKLKAKAEIAEGTALTQGDNRPEGQAQSPSKAP